MAWGRKAEALRAPVKIDRVKNKVEFREDIVTLDFETFYDADYSLSKLSYTDYIRSPLFEAICCGIKVGTGPTIVSHGDGIKKKLARIDWTKHDLLCHNTPFDGFILSHHFGVKPRRYLDTLAMARGLHGNDIRGDLDTVSQFYGGKGKIAGKLAEVKGMHAKHIKENGLWEDFIEYCGNDVDQTYMIFHKMLKVLPPLELTKIDIFIRAFCDPVLDVDRDRVDKELVRELADKERKLLASIGTQAEQTKLIMLLGRKEALEHTKECLGSGPKFAEMLTSLGVAVPMKYSVKQKKDIPALAATDEDFLALQEHPDVQVRELVEARLSVKSTGNVAKAQRFLDVSKNGMKLPILLNYYAAHTGRPGGGNMMNMLNLERGGELRKSILAPKGKVIVVADSGQIEARVAMWIANQMDALEEFTVADRGEDRDPYCKFADIVYGRTITKIDKDERHVGKVAKLQLQYQAGPPRFQTTMALGALGGKPMFIELDECQRIVNAYRRKHDKIVDFWWKCQHEIIPDMVRGREGEWKCLKWEREKIWLPNGMCLKYPGLREHHYEGGVEHSYLRKGHPSKIYGGLLTENIVQALANVIITEQMVKIAEKYRIVMMTYDENAWLTSVKDGKHAFEFGMKIMMTSPDWCLDLPLFAEGGVANYYSK